MTRAKALAVIRSAGYHADVATFVRTYIENRVSYQSAKEAYRQGEKALAAGVRCDCFFCKTNPTSAKQLA